MTSDGELPLKTTICDEIRASGRAVIINHVSEDSHVVAELSTVHPERKVEASIHLVAPVWCDPGRISQLLANLLSNALVHGSPDQPVYVDARREVDLFVLSVTNSGEPISRETQKRLFQPFSRGDGPNHQEGLGLGLYIAYQIAAAHNGTLSLESTLGGHDIYLVDARRQVECD